MMNLTFNEQKGRYEFRCTRSERDGSTLGITAASKAKFRCVGHGAAELVFVSEDPAKALLLARYASSELRAHLQAKVKVVSNGVPVLTYRNGVFIWSGPKYNADGTILFKDLPKKANFAYSQHAERDLPRGAGTGITHPVWWTERPTKAMLCADYADEAAQLAIGQYMAKRHNALEASRATDADIDIPVPAGLAPFPYQKGGVAYAKPRARVLFADEMGLGKTIESILWINICPDVKRVLVICPASLKRNWMREIQKWLVRPATVGIADTKNSQVIPETDIVIINYEILHRKIDTGERKVHEKTGSITPVYDYVLRDSLRGQWDMLIVDECHRLTGDPKTTIRTRMALAIEARRHAWLSGTPMRNKIAELWNIVHHLAPKQFPNKAAFLSRYCLDSNNYRDPHAGARNLNELQEKLRLFIMVRRLKRDVLTELPPKLRQVIELPADGCATLVRQELLAFESKKDILSNMRLRVELAKAGDSMDDYKQAVSVLAKGISVAFEEMSRIRKETALSKVPAVTEHVKSILSEGHKVIVFAHHQEVVEKLHTAFGAESVMMHGGTPAGRRQDEVDAFQTDDRVRVIVGSIGAMGVGWTLTASSYVVLAELAWVPGDVTQAEDRAHRIGQKDSVLVQHLVLEASLDKRMADILVEKQDVADRALDRVSAEEALADPVTPDREKVATQGVSMAEVARLADKLTPADVAAVHMGLRLLAGTHKDSALMDGITFREVDAPLGKVLAGTKVLTPKMAALGKRFLSRYRGTNLAVVPEIQQLFSRTEVGE